MTTSPKTVLELSEPFTAMTEKEGPIKIDMDLVRSVNFFLIMNKIESVGPHHFIRTSMEDCLKKGIITKYASENPVFKDFVMKPVQVKNNAHILNTDSVVFWPFEFLSVELPSGWRMEKGCGCGRLMDSSSVNIIKGDEIVATVSLFSQKEMESII